MNFKESKGIKIGGIVLASLILVIGAIYFTGGGQMSDDNNANIKDSVDLEESLDLNKVSKNDDKVELEEEKKLDDETAKVFSVVKDNEDNLVVLCNKEYMLGENYEPNDLIVPNVPLTYPATYEQSHLREEAGRSLEVMFEDAKKEGLETLYLVSGYRSYKYQYEIFNRSLKNRGKEHTEKYMAKPGHSEHQTGLTADISTQSMGFTLEENFENTKEGEWLAKNAHKYGFILRYPKDRVETTGYAYEPWHFRYVGKEVSGYMYKNKMVLEDLYDVINTNIDAVG